MEVAALSFRVSLRHASTGLALLLLAAVLLTGLLGGGNGLSLHTSAQALRASLPLRTGLWSVWFLLALPAARAALLASEVVYLRSLPVSRAALAFGQACVLALPALPLAALEAADPAGPWRSLLAALALLTGLALSLDAPLAGLALVAASAVHPGLTLCAGLAAPALVWRAFLLAPAVPRAERHTPRRLSLAGALARLLGRTRSEALLRAALLLALTAGLEWLAARQQPAHLGAVAATGALLWTLLGLGPLLTALEEIQTRERWSLIFAPRTAFVRAQLALALPAAFAGGALAAAALGSASALRGAGAGLAAGVAALVSARDLELRAAGPGERVLRVAVLSFFGCLVVWSWE